MVMIGERVLRGLACAFLVWVACNGLRKDSRPIGALPFAASCVGVITFVCAALCWILTE